MNASPFVRSIIAAGALALHVGAAQAACVIDAATPTGVLPTDAVGQDFSFVATDDCATLRFSVIGSTFTRVPDVGAAVGTDRHRYSVSLSGVQWQSVTPPSVTTFRWRITGRTSTGVVTQVTTTNELDTDGDGWTRTGGDVGICDRQVANNPGADEDCGNGVDDDCNGHVDDCAFPLIDADLTVRGGDPNVTYGGIGSGHAVAVGDLDGDGSADLLLGNSDVHHDRGEAYIVDGPSSGTVAASSGTLLYTPGNHGWFGEGVGAGDADGDGFDDALIGSPLQPVDTVYVFHGPITGDRSTPLADAVLVGTRSDFTGYTLRVVPDVDGGGGADFVVGAIDAERSAGVVYVLPGATTGGFPLSSSTYTFVGPDRGEQLGRAAEGIGDQNGDGIDELALGSLAGAYIVDGGLSAGTYVVDDVASSHIGGLSSESIYFGAGLEAADYDGDGMADLFVTAVLASGTVGDSAGTISAFLGPVPAHVAIPDAFTTWQGAQAGDGLGTVATGDVDGDGALDVLMGAAGGGPVGGGVAYLQLGFASGTIDVGTLHSFPSATESNLGAAVATIPDWTGDGGDEVLLGAPNQSGPAGADVGAVYVFYSDSLF
jgi:hypothetical protein